MYIFVQMSTTLSTSSNVVCSTRNLFHFCMNGDDINVDHDYDYKGDDYVEDDDAIL